MTFDAHEAALAVVEDLRVWYRERDATMPVTEDMFDLSGRILSVVSDAILAERQRMQDQFDDRRHLRLMGGSQMYNTIKRLAAELDVVAKAKGDAERERDALGADLGSAAVVYAMATARLAAAERALGRIAKPMGTEDGAIICDTCLCRIDPHDRVARSCVDPCPGFIARAFLAAENLRSEGAALESDVKSQQSTAGHGPEAAPLPRGDSPPRWRVGRRVGRTIYLLDALVGMMDTPALAREATDALNAAENQGTT